MKKEPLPSFIEIPIKKSAPRKSSTENDRQAHCKQWRQSGLSMTEYCRLHNLSLSSLSLWAKRMKLASQPAQQAMLPPPPKQQSVEIRLASGVSLLFSQITDPVTVAQLIKALASCN